MCVFCKKAKATKEFVSKLRPDGPSVPYCAKCNDTALEVEGTYDPIRFVKAEFGSDPHSEEVKL